MPEPIIEYTSTRDAKITVTAEHELRIKIPKKANARTAAQAISEAQALNEKLKGKQIYFTLRGRKSGSLVILASKTQLVKYDIKTGKLVGPIMRSDSNTSKMPSEHFNSLINLCLQVSFITPCVALYERSQVSGDSIEQSYLFARVLAGKLNRLYTNTNRFQADYSVLYEHWSRYGVYLNVYGIDVTKHFSTTLLHHLKERIDFVLNEFPELLSAGYIRDYIMYLEETL